MPTRIDTPNLRSKPYELYKQKFLAWRKVTELRKDVIALSLSENKNQIRENVFEQITIEDLKKEDGLDILIAFLDAHPKKEDLHVADGLEKFEEFEDFQRMNVTKYIA